MSALTPEILRSALKYDQTTGLFTWKVSRGNQLSVGSIAGCILSTGYINITLNGKQFKAHRLAWLYIHGVWPTYQIDHINGVRNDNKITNLRDVTHFENKQNMRVAMSNSKGGFLGVTPSGGGWQARIQINGKRTFLGHFPTPNLAYSAYIKAKREMHTACTI